MHTPVQKLSNVVQQLVHKCSGLRKCTGVLASGNAQMFWPQEMHRCSGLRKCTDVQASGNAQMLRPQETTSTNIYTWKLGLSVGVPPFNTQSVSHVLHIAWRSSENVPNECKKKKKIKKKKNNKNDHLCQPYLLVKQFRPINR